MLLSPWSFLHRSKAAHYEGIKIPSRAYGRFCGGLWPYKQKGNMMACENYRGIKLIEQILGQIIGVRDIQYGFKKGKSTIDTI